MDETCKLTLSEIKSELDGLREVVLAKQEALREIIDERDRLYKERDDSRRTAVDAALAAVKEQTKATFEASEKAIVKAEEAQKSYNSSHNDLSRKMDEQYKAMTPQSEARLKWDNSDREIADIRKELIANREAANKDNTNLRDMIMKEISGLRESRSEGTGKSAGLHNSWGLLLGFASLIVSLIAIASFVSMVFRK